MTIRVPSPRVLGRALYCLPHVIIDRLDEEFLLFALHQDGSWVSRRHGSVRYGLAGAWLLQLLREGRIRQRGKRFERRGKSLVDDEALDMVLGLIHQSKRPRTVTQLVRMLAARAEEAIPWIARRLQGRGYVDITHDERGRERYPLHSSNARQELQAQLLAVMSGADERDLATLDLLCILGAAGMTEELFGPDRRQEAEQRIVELIQYDPHLVYMWKVIRRVRRWRRFAWSPAYHVPEVRFRNVATA